MNPDLARARFFYRLEKVLITIESMVVGIFAGILTSIVLDGKIGALTALFVFIAVNRYKRRMIRREREG